MKKYKRVEVDWIDSVRSSGWSSEKHYKEREPSMCRTAGYIVQRDDKKLVIVGSISDDGDMTDSMTIPASCVKRVRRLFLKEEK